MKILRLIPLLSLLLVAACAKQASAPETDADYEADSLSLEELGLSSRGIVGSQTTTIPGTPIEGEAPAPAPTLTPSQSAQAQARRNERILRLINKAYGPISSILQVAAGGAAVGAISPQANVQQATGSSLFERLQTGEFALVSGGVPVFTPLPYVGYQGFVGVLGICAGADYVASRSAIAVVSVSAAGLTNLVLFSNSGTSYSRCDLTRGCRTVPAPGNLVSHFPTCDARWMRP